jgi:hypothetical protein
MVARITTPNSIQHALNYNEQKIKKGQAELLYAANYLKDADQLNFYDKLRRFTDLISLNERAKTNTLHISLNFHNSDMLSKEKITEIAVEYMDKIGFAEQPYLVYQHHDSGHTHLHIVTTNIQSNGKRIDTFNIGRNQSEKARKELEQKYKLVQAMGRKISEDEIKPSVYKLTYGKSETKRAILNVLAHVLNTYKYSSLAELNAVLKLYNVAADRGSENSRIYKNNGLVYRILDEKGNRIGVPIKASLIYNKPGLKFLEQKFQQNESAKQNHKQCVKNAIDFAFMKKLKPSIRALVTALRKESIDAVLRQNKEGFLYGITYIDFKTGCVFNGSDLGKEYSAKGILQRCALESGNSLALKPELSQNTFSSEAEKTTLSNSIDLRLMDDLIKPELNQNANEPFEVKKFKKKKSLKQRSV